MVEDGGVRLLLLCFVLAASFAGIGCRGKALPEPVGIILPRADTGQPYSFAAHRGQTLVVYFFATWCIPCQLMDPFMAQVQERGRQEGISVVGVALDIEGRRTVGPYVLGMAPPYPVLLGGGDVAAGRSPFGKIPALPAVMILDAAGRPAAVFSGVADTDFILERARVVQRR